MVNCVKEGQNMRSYYFKKAEVIPPRVEEPKLVPTAEAKGFPNPAPKGAWVPKTQRESICFTPLNVFCVRNNLRSSSPLTEKRCCENSP